MAGLRTAMVLIGAVAVLILGATPSVAASVAAAPCHDTAVAVHDDAPSPTQHPDQAMKAMGCCAACVVAPQPPAPPRADACRPSADLSPARPSLPDGLTPSPEPGPPRA